MNNGVFECFVSRVWISFPRELTEDLCLVSIVSILLSPFSFYYSFIFFQKPHQNQKASPILICLSFPGCSNGYSRLCFSMHGPSVDSFSVTCTTSQIPSGSTASVMVLECSRPPVHVWSELFRNSN